MTVIVIIVITIIILEGEVKKQNFWIVASSWKIVPNHCKQNDLFLRTLCELGKCVL